jgi:hypothetical protein
MSLPFVQGTFCHELRHYFLEGHVEALFDGGAEVHMADTSHFRSNKILVRGGGGRLRG